MAAQEAIHQVRENVPGGKYIPSAAEWLPFLMQGGKGESPAAAAEEPAIRTDQIPGRPYQPNPRYQPRPEPEPLPQRTGPLLLKGEVQEPGAPLPENPGRTILQGNALSRGPRPVVDPAAGLGEIPVRTPAPSSLPFIPRTEPVAEPEPPRTSTRVLGKALNQELPKALGYQPPQPPQPGVPIGRQRLPFIPQTEAPAQTFAPKTNLMEQLKNSPETLPEGHAPIEGSSKLRSYKYDPSSQELHVQYRTGDIVYAYRGVTPEQAQYFTDAIANGESAGQAIRGIENANPYDKISNGQRTRVRAEGTPLKQQLAKQPR